MIEHILAAYEQAYSLRSACLRYFNAAGDDPEREIGERNELEKHMIPLIL
jgi:UDP-glucose 4-epimerase